MIKLAIPPLLGIMERFSLVCHLRGVQEAEVHQHDRNAELGEFPGPGEPIQELIRVT